MDEYGVVHIFGVKGTVAYLTVQGDDLDHTNALDVEVKDEEGKVITNRLDDKRINVSIDGTLKSSTSFESIIGAQFTYAGTQYICKGVTDRGTNSDYRKVTLKGVKYQEIA
ncbi:MAG: hypothetical protein ACK5VI_10015 [Opitutia bacterium]|jgi:hypothetical protein